MHPLKDASLWKILFVAVILVFMFLQCFRNVSTLSRLTPSYFKFAQGIHYVLGVSLFHRVGPLIKFEWLLFVKGCDLLKGSSRLRSSVGVSKIVSFLPAIWFGLIF